MDIGSYKNLIASLPVRQQSFKTKRKTWKKAEEEIDWLQDLNNEIFNGEEVLNVSRQDILNTNNLRELILKVLYWGYPGGMRGNHFINILKSIQILEKTFLALKRKDNLNSEDFIKTTTAIKGITGLGLSTYSKLLYFLNLKFNDTPCLILDQRLIDVFANNSFDDFSSLSKISYEKAESRYVEYLQLMNKLTVEMETNGENIETFLFMFGNNLKPSKIPTFEIPQMWNGYCPESLLLGEKVRMRLNSFDFFESEKTGLQICVLSGVQAIILNFRGEGKFKSTLSFGDEIENGEILSPQNTDLPPFNNPAVVFQKSEEMENYIKSIN